MITGVKAFSSWRSAPTLLASVDGIPETDLIQIRDIQGADPVKASVSTSALGAVDGASFTGSSIETRNIVLTLHPNPDWDTWTFAKIRRLLYLYFTTKRPVKLEIYSDDTVPVQITGIVEDVSPNIFSKDPEFIVSIICPDPYFTAIDPVILTGVTGETTVVDYAGNIPAGINLQLRANPDDPEPTDISVQIGEDPVITLINVLTSIGATRYFELNSLPLRKYVQTVSIPGGAPTNRLSRVHDSEENAMWPTLENGENELIVNTDFGVHNWTLKYFDRYGGL